MLEYYPQGKRDTRLEVPYGVELSHLAFSSNVFIEYLNLPSSMSEIPSCIGNLRGLREVVLPETITSIGNSFYYCLNLESINFPDSLISIGNIAFMKTNLSVVHIPASVESIGDGAFSDIPSLVSLTVDDANPYYTAIGNILFTKDMKNIVSYATSRQETEYIIPDTIEEIGRYAFAGAQFTRMYIPDNVTRIGNHAFARCPELLEISFPAVQFMGDRIFFHSITTNHPGEFLNPMLDTCPKLENIYIRGLREEDFTHRDVYNWRGTKNGIEYTWATQWNYFHGNWGHGAVFYPVIWGAE